MEECPMNTFPGLFHPARSIAAITALGLSSLALATEPAAFAGSPVAVGLGTAHVLVMANASNAPDSVAVILTRDALEGLPDAQPGQMAWEFELPMPDTGPRTGFDHVVLDWNPAGHLPDGVYSVPHFDVHFYVISNGERSAVTFHGAGREAAMAAPAPELVPAGYVIPPDTAVDKMGMHGINPAGHEFHGQAFDHTFIYGYYKGELTFVEPMVSMAFLQSLPEVTAPVVKPLRYSYSAWYPASYRISFDAGRNEYAIALQNLERFE